MEETSVAIAASAAVASLADWVDLDGNLLLADDPFDGLELGPDKRWQLTDRPGLGVTRDGSLNRFTHVPYRCSGRYPPMWRSSWTKSWTSPLPGGRTGAYDVATPVADPEERRREGPETHRPRSGFRTTAPVGLGFVLPAQAERVTRPVGMPRDRRKGGMPSMGSSTAAARVPDPDAADFIRFCYRRRRVGWPELYDEMCAVAARGLFKGLGTEDLAAHGIGFSLFDMPALAAMSSGIVAEEQALRRPVAVVIMSIEPETEETEPSSTDQVELGGRDEHPVQFAAVPAGA